MRATSRKASCSFIAAFLLALFLVFQPLSPCRADADSAAHGKMSTKTIVVTLSTQWLHAYLQGKDVFNTPVMTGRPELPTPPGTYHVLAKMSPTTFTSPWPVGSPNWYPPTHINYALEWKAGGYFLHDSWWHSVYGPGTDRVHNDPQFGMQPGSHGCIAMPLAAARWLYNWAPIGTTVQIVA